jgi:hypothetical protein
VAAGVVPLALLAVPLAGAIGAVLGARGARLGPAGLMIGSLAASAALGAAGLVQHPAGLVGVALFYGLYRLVLVVADARLQDRIGGPARATVTSVAGVGGELAAAALYGAWAVGGLGLVTLLAAVAAAVLPRLLRERGAGDPELRARARRRPRRPPGGRRGWRAASSAARRAGR